MALFLVGLYCPTRTSLCFNMNRLDEYNIIITESENSIILIIPTGTTVIVEQRQSFQS